MTLCLNSSYTPCRHQFVSLNIFTSIGLMAAELGYLKLNLYDVYILEIVINEPITSLLTSTITMHVGNILAD